MLIYLYSVMEDGITASLYTYLTDLTVFAKSEGIPMGTHSLHKIERQHIKMPPLGAKVPDPYAPFSSCSMAATTALGLEGQGTPPGTSRPVVSTSR